MGGGWDRQRRGKGEEWEGRESRHQGRVGYSKQAESGEGWKVQRNGQESGGVERESKSAGSGTVWEQCDVPTLVMCLSGLASFSLPLPHKSSHALMMAGHSMF